MTAIKPNLSGAHCSLSSAVLSNKRTFDSFVMPQTLMGGLLFVNLLLQLRELRRGEMKTLGQDSAA